MRSYLRIFDVSPMLYAGHMGQVKNAFSASTNMLSNGIPIGGIRYTLRRAISDIFQGYDVLFCFDSKTDKTKYYKDYKSNRSKNPDIYIQQLMLEDAVKGCGLPYLKKDGYEADDLVAYAIPKVLNYPHIEIVTSDMDLSANLICENISLVGASSAIPTINISNFEQTVKGNAVIAYNTILPYYMFFGKPSNNVKAYRDSATNRTLYVQFINFCNENGILTGKRSTKTAFAKWMWSCLEAGTLSKDDAEELLNRMNFIYPKDLQEPLDVNTGDCETRMNLQKLSFFLKVFNLDTVLSSFGLSDYIMQTKTKEVFNYENTYKKEYTEGTFGVDTCGTADMSLFATTEDQSEIFVQDGDF